MCRGGCGYGTPTEMWGSLPKLISELGGITRKGVRGRVAGEMCDGVGGSTRDKDRDGITGTARIEVIGEVRRGTRGRIKSG